MLSMVVVMVCLKTKAYNLSSQISMNKKIFIDANVLLDYIDTSRNHHTAQATKSKVSIYL